MLGLMVALGIVIPLVMQWRSAGANPRPSAAAPLLILIGGLMFRAVIVLSSDAARSVWPG